MPAARFSVLCLLVAFAGAALAQAPPAAGDHRLEILLERRDHDQWRVAEPGEVLEQGNEVRFRLTSNLDGRLFAYNRAPDGQTRLIFPDPASDADNRITSGREFLLPEDGSFAIDGPPGHEVIYWVVSPEDKREPPVAISQLLGTPHPTPPRINPTCDDTVLRARGVCVDDHAGAQKFALPNSSAMPRGLIARSINIQADQHASVITTPRTHDGFIIFEYRIAHR